MRPITFTMGPYAAASATAICLAQTPAAAGPLTLNGPQVVNGVGVLDTARNVLITAAGNESAHLITIEGTDARGDAIAETLPGPNAASVATVDNFITITGIRISGPAAGAITVGTQAANTSRWVRLDEYVASAMNYSFVANGGVNYTVQQTFDDPNSPSAPVPPGQVNWQPSGIAGLVGATTTQQGVYTPSPIFLRVLFGSGAGSLTCSFVQPGAPP